MAWGRAVPTRLPGSPARDRSAPAPRALRRSRQPDRSQTSQRCLRPPAASRHSMRVAAARPGPGPTARRARRREHNHRLASQQLNERGSRGGQRSPRRDREPSATSDRPGTPQPRRKCCQRRGDRVAFGHPAQPARSQRSRRTPVQACPSRDLTIEISPPDTHQQPQTPRRATSRRKRRRCTPGSHQQAVTIVNPARANPGRRARCHRSERCALRDNVLAALETSSARGKHSCR